MRALRGKPTARAWKGDHGRRSAAASGDRSAPGEGPHHRVPVPERGLWTLRKGYPCTIAGGDRRTFWTAIAAAVWALRGKPTARAWKGDHGRRSAAASGDRSAPGEGPHHRVPVPERGLWTLRKGYPCTIAGGDRRTVWAAIDGADRVL